MWICSEIGSECSGLVLAIACVLTIAFLAVRGVLFSRPHRPSARRERSLIQIWPLPSIAGKEAHTIEYVRLLIARIRAEFCLALSLFTAWTQEPQEHGLLTKTDVTHLTVRQIGSKMKICCLRSFLMHASSHTIGMPILSAIPSKIRFPGMQ